MAFRFLAESAFTRALPPLAAPSADRAWACGFFPSAGFRTSPVASSTTRRAFWAKSVRLPPLLAREGISCAYTAAVRQCKQSWIFGGFDGASGEVRELRRADRMGRSERRAD